MKCRATPTVNSEFDRSKRCIFTSFLCVPNPYTFDHFVSFRDLRCSVAQHLATIELYMVHSLLQIDYLPSRLT